MSDARPVKPLPGVHFLGMLLDLMCAVLLAVYAILIGPLGVLRGPIVLERAFWYCSVLLPQGAMTRAIRAAVDWRLGHFDAAIAQVESLVGQNEDYLRAKPHSRMRRRVLEDLYTVLARAYMHAGHIDNAMLVVIRAKKCMGIERLAGLAGLDAKTAHLVRAGLAAGRLLDGGGLATMFVKSTQTEARPGAGKDPAGTPEARPRQGATRDPEAPRAQVPAEGGAKIIPFKPRELI